MLVDLSDEWLAFIGVELDVFSMTLTSFCVYVVVAIMCRFAIPVSGPVLLRGRYFSNVEQYSYDDNGITNIVFRILAPVFVSYLLLAIAFFGWNALHPGWFPQIRWMPIMLYWILYIALATAKHSPSYPIWTLLIQALTSLAAALYFDWAVVCRIPEDGIIAFDQSNIGWQVLVVSFFAVGAMVLFGIKRGLARYNGRLLNAYYASAVFSSDKSGISQKTERWLFSHLRRYDSLLPDSYKRDELLRALLYTIMYIEDSNRPKWFRLFERAFFWTGRVKSTGIMQVRSRKALSDQESVELAIPKVKTIWESFVVQVAKSNAGSFYPLVSFTGNWYRYNYELMRSEAAQSTSYLYGKYCGTFSLDVGKIFLDISKTLAMADNDYRKFDVFVRSNLFAADASWIPGRELCFDAGRISLLASDFPREAVTFKASNNDGIGEEGAREAVDRLSSIGTIVSVEFIPYVRCAITMEASSSLAEEIAKAVPGWIISTADVLG